MQDNVRIGKESLTKKISYHEQHPKKYSTIQSLQKEPTRKNIKLQYPASIHLTIQNIHSSLSINTKTTPKENSKVWASTRDGRRKLEDGGKAASLNWVPLTVSWKEMPIT